jgi:hypothetical protein
MKKSEPTKIDEALKADLIAKVFGPLKPFFDERDAAQAKLKNLEDKAEQLEQQDELLASEFSRLLIESTDAIAAGRDVGKLQTKIKQTKEERAQVAELLKSLEEDAIPAAYRELKQKKADLCNAVWGSVKEVKPAYQGQVSEMVSKAFDIAEAFEDAILLYCRQRGINLSEGVFLGQEKIHKLLNLVNQTRLSEFVRARGW